MNKTLAFLLGIVLILLLDIVFLFIPANGFSITDETEVVGNIPFGLLSRIHENRKKDKNEPPSKSNQLTTRFNSAFSTLQSNNVSVVDVYDFGAEGDGKTDDTAAFQAALTSVSNAGGGIVMVPRGYFLFKGSISIPSGVTLRGTYDVVPSHPMVGHTSLPWISGTLFLPTADRGNENGTSFITLHRDSVLRGVVIYYPDQTISGTLPVPYPWTVDMQQENAAVFDVEALNSWNFIRANNSGRHYIARCQGQPINIGIYIDQTYDIGRVEDVHFNPWYSTDKTFMSWQLGQGRAFVIARSDWEYVFNTFAFGYAIGYHFIKSAAGSCNGNFVGIGADMAVNASILVDSSDAWGILITNGEFTSFIDHNFGNFSNIVSTQVVVSPSNTGAVRFVNSAFWGPSYHIANIQGSGTVGFGDCTFNAWDVKGQGLYAINMNGTGNLFVRGCEFQQEGNQVQIGLDVSKSVVTGNIMKGQLKINDESRRAVVGLNAYDS